MPASRNTAPGAEPEKSFFEQQRDQLVSEIALSLEHVLMNMNLLNRSLESIIAPVGKEFESVESLWSQFENVMAKNPEDTKGADGEKEETILRGMEYERQKQSVRQWGILLLGF